MNDKDENRKSDSRAGAGLAGVGSGTGLVAVAQGLPDDNVLKPWLLFAAPALAIGASAIWLWAQMEVANLIQDWRIKLVAKRLRAYLNTALSDPNCTPEHQHLLQQRLEEVDIIIADRDLELLKKMTPITADDVAEFSERASSANETPDTKT